MKKNELEKIEKIREDVSYLKDNTWNIKWNLKSLNRKMTALLICAVFICLCFAFFMIGIYIEASKSTDNTVKMQQTYREHDYMEIGKIESTNREWNTVLINDETYKISCEKNFNNVRVGDWVGIYESWADSCVNSNNNVIERLPNYAVEITNKTTEQNFKTKIENKKIKNTKIPEEKIKYCLMSKMHLCSNYAHCTFKEYILSKGTTGTITDQIWECYDIKNYTIEVTN